MQSGIKFKQGEIWLLPFPYSDFTSDERRPVLILSKNEFNLNSPDLLVCQITTTIRNEETSLSLEQKDLEYGVLPSKSEIRCHKINIIDKKLFIKKFSQINDTTFQNCIKKIKNIIDKPQSIASSLDS